MRPISEERTRHMRTDPDHLPPAKQRELERVVQILFEEFEEARSLATQDWKKKGRILKIILYGSYARGGWVDEPHTAKGYQSDFDLLIIVNDERLTDRVEYWVKAEERLNRELAITKTLRTPVNFIVHTLHEVNDGLAHGRFFFMDVARDGIAHLPERRQRACRAQAQDAGAGAGYGEGVFRGVVSERRCSGSTAAKFRIEQGQSKATRHSTFIKPPSVSIIAFCWSALSTRRTCTISGSCAPRRSALIGG